MADIRKNMSCTYCGLSCHIKFSEDLIVNFCCFCGEGFADPDDELEDEEDDGDLDYTDDDRNELDN